MKEADNQIIQILRQIQTGGGGSAGVSVGNVGMVSAVEAYVNRNISSGGLPVIDGYQTLENNRVFLGAQSNPIQNGVWTVHAAGPWVRPADFANGMTLRSGQLIFAAKTDSELQFGGVWIQCDNASDDQISFTIGIDPINSLSIQQDNGLPAAGFPNVSQGPFLDMAFYGRTPGTSELGAGQPLWDIANNFIGVDANQKRLANLPDPTSAQDAATKNYVDARPAVTFANAPASPAEGRIQAFTNSTTNTWGATIAGGGANHVLGYYNGTNWTVIGK